MTVAFAVSHEAYGAVSLVCFFLFADRRENRFVRFESQTCLTYNRVYRRLICGYSLVVICWKKKKTKYIYT